MEGFTSVNNTVVLIDSYTEESRKLHHSLKQAGFEYPVYSLEEDGYLPEGVTSVYGYFMGDYKTQKDSLQRPRYFNEISVPDYWEISCNGSNGFVHDLQRERAKSFFAEPRNKRFIKIVDWYDEQHIVRFSDHYNQYGALFARTTFNAKGQKVNKTYFAVDGTVAIEENYVVGTIIVTEGEKVTVFGDKGRFLAYFAEKTALKDKRIIYNTLATPFLISQSLCNGKKEDILFWQEPVRPDIPGNMTYILNGSATRTGVIYVQNRAAYEKLISLGANPSIVKCLGFLYPFEREPSFAAEALICTNSDQIEHLSEVVHALPKVKFHIAAITEMSSKLMEFDREPNVSLYPNVKTQTLNRLYQKCSLYFDINHQSEMTTSVYRAFLNNQLLFAFEETAHRKDYVLKSQIYPAAGWNAMTEAVTKVMEDRSLWEKAIIAQREFALTETAEAYTRELN